MNESYLYLGGDGQVLDMIIDNETCTKCSFCAAICPVRAIDWEKDQYPVRNPERAKICIECGQCMAICPHKSIRIAALEYDKDLFELLPGRMDYESFYKSTASRRSIRNFKDKSVPAELLEKIIDVIAQAPMGFPPHKTALTVIQNRSVIEKMLPLMLKFYEDMLRWMKNPIMRYFIKRNAGAETFATIKNHLIPIMELRVPSMKAGGPDEITRGAAALILFHADRISENHTQDANIALTYGLLAAHSLGLGATAISLIPPPVNRTVELRAMLNLPDNHEVVSAMVLGYPKYPFQRGIKRELASVHWM